MRTQIRIAGVTGVWAMIALSWIGPVLAAPPAADVKGSQDHPLISRFPGSTIVGYFHTDWDQTQFPLSNEFDNEKKSFTKPDIVEGAVTRIVYLSAVGKSPLEVFRSYQQALTQAGLRTKFSCDVDCTPIFWRWTSDVVSQSFHWTQDSLHDAINPENSWGMYSALSFHQARVVYGTLNRGGRDVNVMVYTCAASPSEAQAAMTVVEIAEPKVLSAGQIVVNTNTMETSLAEDGKIALYGLYFDTGKAVVRPESKPQLDEMAKLLRAHKDYAVFIVGHTDNVGQFEANVALSRQRAEAVRDALVRDYQIAAARLTPYGVANVAPVSSNVDDAGRGRNRRVELVLR